MKNKDCIFCNIEETDIILKNEMAFVIKDKFPQSKGHLLIIPIEHAEDYFYMNKEIQRALNDLLNESKIYCDGKFNPSGYNVSINSGKSAGQIVMHAHIHLIPRY